jgi:MFS family permease
VFALLRQRNFALVWFGGLISLTGDRVLSTALPFHIYEQTGSTLATGIMIMANILPYLLLSSIAGVFVDRWSRKYVMVVANFSRAVILLALFWAPVSGWLWVIYTAMFVESAISTFFGPAENALLPHLVREDRLLTANSLNALNNTLARLIGPPLGGILLGVLELNSAVLFDITSYLVAGFLITFVSLPPSHCQPALRTTDSRKAHWHRFWDSWREGVRIVGRIPIVSALFLVVGIMTFAGTMMDTLITPFVYDVLHGSALVLGWLLTAQGCGGLIGGIIIGQWGYLLKPVTLLELSLVITGLILLIMFNIPSLPLSIVLFFLLGFPMISTRAGIQTILQHNVPDEYLGRVYGFLGTISALLEVISVGLASSLGDFVGVVPILNVAAGLTLVAGGVALLIFPRPLWPNSNV